MNDTYDAPHTPCNDEQPDNPAREPDSASEPASPPDAPGGGIRWPPVVRWMAGRQDAASAIPRTDAPPRNWLRRAVAVGRLASTRRHAVSWPALSLWARTAAARAWHITRHASSAESRGDVSPSYSAVRRWSPLAAPVLLDALLMALAALLARHAIGRVNVPWQHVTTLAVALLVLSVLVAVALYAAPNDTMWTATLGLGIAAYFTVAVVVLFGPLAGAGVALLLIVAGGTFVRERLHPVMEQTVHVTTLFGRYHRTLLPGVNVLLPGERMLAILQTQPQEHTTLPLRASTANGLENQATATIRYELVPEEAHRAVLVTRDWQRNLRQILAATVRDELANWDPAWRDTERNDPLAESASDGPSSRESAMQADVDRLARRVERRVREQVLRWGVQIAWVHLHDVVLPSPSERPAPLLADRPTERVATERPPVPAPVSVAPDAWRAPRLQSPAFPRIGRGSTEPLGPSPVQPAQIGAGPPQEPAAGAPDAPTPPRKAPRLLARFAGFARSREREEDPPASAAASGGQTPASPGAENGGRSTTGDGRATGTIPATQQMPMPAAPALAPAVLASAYEAVREGRISDPATVRQIADAFEQLAAATDPDAELDLDPRGAANNLRQRAQELTPTRGYDAELAPEPPHRSAQRPTPRRVERDENLTAGG